jgi:hypothetical protein
VGLLIYEYILFLYINFYGLGNFSLKLSIMFMSVVLSCCDTYFLISIYVIVSILSGKLILLDVRNVVIFSISKFLTIGSLSLELTSVNPPLITFRLFFPRRNFRIVRLRRRPPFFDCYCDDLFCDFDFLYSGILYYKDI